MFHFRKHKDLNVIFESMRIRILVNYIKQSIISSMSNKTSLVSIK